MIAEALVEAGELAAQESTEQEQHGKALGAFALLGDGNAGAGTRCELHLRPRQQREQLGRQSLHRDCLGSPEVHDALGVFQFATYLGQRAVRLDQAIVQLGKFRLQILPLVLWQAELAEKGAPEATAWG